MEWLKIVAALVTPFKWLYSLVVELPKIEFSFTTADNWSWQSVPVQHEGGNQGKLFIAVHTRSKKPVEITKIEVWYAAPTQLFDLGNRDFFTHQITTDNEFPFAMTWSGTIEIKANMKQLMGVGMRFPSFHQSCQLKVVVHARTMTHSLGGYIGHGRVHTTLKKIVAKLVAKPVAGIIVSPNCLMVVAQPFLIESAMHASTPSGEESGLIVHTMTDGVAESREVKIPKKTGA